MISDFKSLVHMLRHRATVDPDRVAFIFLTGNDLQESRLTYEQLDREARAIAATLSKYNVVGQPVLLLEPPGLRFMATLFGCFYAGAIVVPNYPPAPRETSKTSIRFLRIVEDARPTVLVGSGKSLATAERMAPQGIPCLDLDSIDHDGEGDWTEPELSDTDVALVHYTSGSTGSPKGVILTHRNFLTNLKTIATATRVSEDSVGISWLPPYHDMGLTCILLPVYAGFMVAHMSPQQFIFHPFSWLEAITRYSGTISAAPNFAYDLCASRISQEQRAKLNLASWEVALNGAESIRYETLNRFSNAFADCGFKSFAMQPCYGLAEATLWVSGKTAQTEPLIGRFRKMDLEQGLVVPLGEEGHNPAQEDLQERMLVSVGQIADGFDLRIVNTQTGSTTPANQVGEIWISGSSVCSGYWNNWQATQEAFADRVEDGVSKSFLKTGDLGFVHKNELYLTGRLKDLIIVRGLNYYPQDIEQACEIAHPAVMSNGACAFMIEQDDSEQIAVVCEISRTQLREADLDDVMQRIQAAVGEELGLQVVSVVLLKQGTLPRTTSGKLRRSACAQSYRDDLLNPLTRLDLSSYRGVGSGLSEEQAYSSVSTHLFLPETKQGETLKRWRLLEDLETSPYKHQIELLETHILRQLSALLRLKEPAVERRTPVKQLGLDSLALVELHLTLEAEFQISVDPGLYNSSDTVQEISEVIQKCLLAPLCQDQELKRDNQAELIDEGEVREIPLLPIQQELLQQNAKAPSDNFVMLLLRTPVEASPKQIRSVLQWLVARHDAFKLCFRFFEERWHQEHANSDMLLQFEILNMRGLKGERVKAQAAAVEDELLKGFDLERGPLLRSFLYDRGSKERGVLCLAFHHLAIDALSIITLVSEFNQCWNSLERGQGYPPLRIPEPSFGSWARRQSSLAQSRELEAEVDYWVSLASTAEASWPSDSVFPRMIEGKDTTDGSIIEGELTGDQADHILKRWNSAENQHDLFLAALAFSWIEATGKDSCYVELEHHGRSHLAGESKPQHTVGWLVHHFPHLVKVPHSDDKLNFFESVRQSRSGIPNEGVGFGLLRYMSENELVRERMGKISIPKLRFVYRGRLDDTFRSNVPFPIMKHSAYGQDSFPDPHNPALVLYAQRSRKGFGWHFRYSPERFPADKVNFLSQGIKKFLQACHNPINC